MSKFLTREEIATAQLAQLRQLLKKILPGNRFYQQKFSGIKTSLASLEDFSNRFPFTTKTELVEDQLAHPLYGTNLTFPLKNYTRLHQTSGTTSAPLRWLDTPESWNWMCESWQEIFRVAGVGAGDRIYFAFSFGPFIGFWLAFEAGQQLGCICIPGGGLSSESRLRAILENAATVLCCTPTYAIRLAEVAANEKINLNAAKIKTIIVAGEPGGSIPATRKRLEKLWPRAKIFDHHGMTETGPVTYECPVRPGVLHVIESAYFAEIIDANGKKVGSGETGELVLTPLGRVGSPIFRYRTGDLVKPENIQHSTSNIQHSTSKPCLCGRHELALEGGILGRTDDMVIVRGVNIYPSAVEEILRGFSEISEYQAQVDASQSLAELKIQIEIKPDCADTAGLNQRVEQALQKAFSLRVPVLAVPAGTLPRFEMKAKRWVVTPRHQA